MTSDEIKIDMVVPYQSLEDALQRAANDMNWDAEVRKTLFTKYSAGSPVVEEKLTFVNVILNNPRRQLVVHVRDISENKEVSEFSVDRHKASKETMEKYLKGIFEYLYKGKNPFKL